MNLTPKQELGQQLRRLRDGAGLQARQVAEALGIEPQLASRFELGQRWINAEQITAWAVIAGLDKTQADDLVADLANARREDRLLRNDASYSEKAMQVERSKRFAAARHVQTLAVAEVPPYLQTVEYALEQLDDEPEAAAIAGMRQADFAAVGNSRRSFKVILLESALRIRPCNAAAMRGQISRLQGIVDMPGVEFGVVPFNIQLGTPIKNAFTVFDDIAVIDTTSGEIELSPKRAVRYSALMDELWNEAARGEQARALLTAATNALTDS